MALISLNVKSMDGQNTAIVINSDDLF